MLNSVTVKHRSLYTIGTLNNSCDFSVNSATTGTGTKRRSMNILLAVIVTASRTVRAAASAVCYRIPVKPVLWSVEVTNLFVLDLKTTNNTFLRPCPTSVLGE